MPSCSQEERSAPEGVLGWRQGFWVERQDLTSPSGLPGAGLSKQQDRRFSVENGAAPQTVSPPLPTFEAASKLCSKVGRPWGLSTELPKAAHAALSAGVKRGWRRPPWSETSLLPQAGGGNCAAAPEGLSWAGGPPPPPSATPFWGILR